MTRLMPLLAVVACAQPLFEQTAPLPQAVSPNVLLILLDDVGTDKIGVYEAHPQPARTPVIDGLAASGTRFANAYAYPLCAPSRAALLTGQYARRHGIGANTRTSLSQALPSEAATLPEMLAQAKVPYTSAGVGKWHLAEGPPDVSYPKEQGFSYFAGPLDNLLEPESYEHYPWYTDDGQLLRDQEAYLTTREIDEAIVQAQTLPEPWFVFVSLHAPHRPWTAPPEELLSEPAAPDAEAPALFDATLEAADTEIGRLLAEIDLENTLVMLIGDNGNPEMVVVEPSDPSQAKNTLFEGGIHVPWIAAGVGVSAGVVSDELVHIVDVFPTLAESAGLLPDRPGHPVDGVSLWPALLGREHQPRQYAFSEKYTYDDTDPSTQALRNARYKVIRSDDGFEGLYDLEGRVDDGPNLLEGALTDAQEEAHAQLIRELDRIDADLSPTVPSSGCGG